MRTWMAVLSINHHAAWLTGSRLRYFSTGVFQHARANFKCDLTRRFMPAVSRPTQFHWGPVRTLTRGASNSMNHYERLGIRPPSDPKEIKVAYLKKAKECHPDIHGEASTQDFQKLSHAFSVLSDPKSKASYDTSLRSYAQDSAGPRDWHEQQQAGSRDMSHDFDPAEIFRKAWSETAAADYFDTIQQELGAALQAVLLLMSLIVIGSWISAHG